MAGEGLRALFSVTRYDWVRASTLHDHAKTIRVPVCNLT